MSSPPRGLDAAGRHHTRGFTLLELVVTMVLIAVLAGLASIAVTNGGYRQARSEIEQLFRVLRLMSDEAVLSGEEFGLVVDDASYRLLRLDPQREDWVPLEASFVRERTLPPRLHMTLRQDGTAPARPAGATGYAVGAPAIVLRASGEISPFELEFRLDGADESPGGIGSDGSGTLRLR